MDSYRTPISSKQVSEFMPLNLWTEVVLISNKNNTFIVTTEEKIIKRTIDMKKIAEQSSVFEKVQDFKPSQMVAVEVEGEWCRGKLISHNEYKSENTTIELIDFGSFYQTNLENVFNLPYYYSYGQLALPIQFQCIIQKTKKLTIKPDLCKSKLYKGVVFVDVICNNIKINESEVEKGNVDPEKELPISIRKITFPRKQKQTKIPLRNGDCCIIRFVEDISIYVAKVIKDEVTSKYVLWQNEIVQDTFESTDKIHKDNPLVGDKVKVFSQLKGGFFRAKILRKNNCGSFDILYIDYGSKETIPSNEIYQLADKLLKPGLAVEVKIKSFQRNYNYDTFINSGKPFVIEFDVTSNYCFENVKFKEIDDELYINNNNNNNNQFTVDCLMKKLEIKSNVTQINESSKLINDHNFNHNTNIKKNEIVYLTHFEAMDEVYVVRNITQFNEINRIIQNCTTPEHKFNEGDLVCISNISGKYRARIVKILSSCMVYVLNIDYGFYETVMTTSIFKLHNKNVLSTLNLVKISELACKVRIKGSFNIEKSLLLIQFINNIQGVPLLMECSGNIEGCEEVVLRKNDKYCQNIFDEFIPNNKFETILTEPTISNITENNEVMNDTKRCLSNDFENIVLKNGDFCIVTHFKDFKNIYLCKAVKNDADIYETHNMDIISKTLHSKDLKMKTNKIIGDFVKVNSPAYQQLRRAKIIDVKENSCFHVSYIDFGDSEVVHSRYIFELSTELNEKTELPIRVSIDVPPNVKETDKIEKLFKNLKQKASVLSIEFKQPSTNGLEHVILKELESGNSINNKILELSLENLPIRNGDSCILTYFENFDCIYVSKGHELINKKMFESIKSITDWKIKVNPVVGDIVIVNSLEYNELFRAKIISVLDEGFHVSFIDYGDSEVVRSSDIFELSDDLKNKPGLAIKIGMNMFCNETNLEKVQIIFQTLAVNEEPLLIEFDESSAAGIKNCILKVISTDLNINDKVLKLI